MPNVTFDLYIYNGQVTDYDLATNPDFYYPSNENDIIFNCGYNAPSGQVDVIFPDNPCSSFDFLDAYSGQVLENLELLLDIPYIGNSGEELDLTLSIFKIVPLDVIDTGEEATASLYSYKILDPIGYSGEEAIVTSIYLPPIITFDPIGYSGEETAVDVATTYLLSSDAYTGEYAYSSLTPVDYSTYIASEGPAAYWKFDEQSGSLAIDYTGNNTSATIVSTSIGNISPVASKYSFYFDGINSLVVGNPVITSSNITQELWVMPAVGATITLYSASATGTQGLTGQRYAVLPYYNGSGSGGGISIGTNGIQVVAYGTSYAPILLSYQNAISTTQFTHVLVSWNDKTPSLYVNGVLIGTGYQARAPFAAQGLPKDTNLGAYKGYMQDVAIYNSALSEEQAREHYLAGIGLHYIPRFEPVPSYSGEEVTASLTPDLTPFGYIYGYFGEELQAVLQNNAGLSVDAYSSEYLYINENILRVIPNTTFTYFHGSNTHSETSSCLTLDSAISATGGINATFYLPSTLNLQSISELNIRFKRTNAASWYDDDFTDAELSLYIYPNWLTSEIVYLSAYSRPYERSGGNAQTLVINYRLNSSNPIHIRWLETSTVVRTGNLTVDSYFTTSEMDGTDTITTNIVTSGAGTTITVYGANGTTVRQHGTFSNMADCWTNNRSTTNNIILFHYHNYQSNKPEVLCDIEVFEYEGFVLSPTSSLGSIDAYSSESSFIDELVTASIFSPNFYGGELNETTLSVFPSISLGVVQNYSGEELDLVLLATTIFSEDFYSDEELNVVLSIFPSSGIGILSGNSGEDVDLLLSVYPILRNIDGIEGQEANIIVTTVPPIHFSLDVYSSENALVDLSIELAIEINGYSGEEQLAVLDTHPAIVLGIVGSYTGSVVENIQVTTTAYLYPIAYSGEEELVVLTTYLPPQLSLPFYTGQDILLSLAKTALLDGNAYTDQYANATLSIFISTPVLPYFYTGSVADVLLRTVDRLVPLAYTGQENTTDLTISPAIPIYPQAYTGQEAIATILPGITFPSLTYTGNNTSFDLSYVINTGMPAGWYDGEEASITLSTINSLPFIGYSGEEVLIYFGSSYALYAQAYYGAYAEASITLNPFDQLGGLGYSGQDTDVLISTTTRLPNIGYSGELSLFDLHQSLAPNILIPSYSGQNVLLNLQISFQLPIGRSYTGSEGVLNQIDTEPNIHFYTGVDFSNTLSTTDVLSLTAIGSGEILFATLQVGKSQAFEVIRFYPGSTLSATFDTIHHANLYVLFRTSIMTQVDIGSATYFDLNTDTCCGVRNETLSNNLLMHLYVKDYLPEAVSYGNRVTFSVDLSCRPRFSVDFETGTTFSLEDYNGYLSIDFSTGASSFFNGFEPDLNHRLCKGYFIPNGTWLVVELNDILLEDCYTNMLYSGSTMSCVLSDDIVLRVSDNGAGEAMIPSLLTSPPWLFIFYSGENLLCNLSTVSALHPVAYTGENVPIKFYQEPFINYSGESASAELTIIYHVRFKESGCFDNNFTFQNDDGDLIPELSNPVPVEGEPFYHSVLGECF